MTRIALRGIRSHPGRFLLSVLAVLLGVAFMAGTLSLRQMMSDTFDRIVAAGTNGDAYVESLGDVSLPLDLAEEIGAVEAVAGVVPSVGGLIVLVGKDGTVVQNGAETSRGIGIHPDDRGAVVIAGRAPENAGEIALETATMRRSRLAVGDGTTVMVNGELRSVEVVGEYDLEASATGAFRVVLDLGTAVAAYAPDRTTDVFEVYAADGVSQSELARAIERALAGTGPAADLTVLTGAEMRAQNVQQLRSTLGFVSTFLLVFAAIALFIGSFIIANTFQMVVRRSRREYALLRAVGASPGQVYASVLVQAGVIGLVGSALGLGAGLGLVTVLRSVLAARGLEMSGDIPLDGSTVAVSVATGALVSLVASLGPARRAALTAPVEAMRDEARQQDRPTRTRTRTGVTLLVSGLAAVAWGVVVDPDGAGLLLASGAFAVVTALLVLAPVLVPTAVSVLAAPIVRCGRPLGGLARGNVTRHPKRTASTASALMIGAALVAGAAVLAASTQASLRGFVDDRLMADLVVEQPATWDVPTALLADLPAVDGVTRVDAIRATWSCTVDAEQGLVVTVPEDFFARTLAVATQSGDVNVLGPGRAVVEKLAADARGWAVGDTVTIAGDAGATEVTVAGVFDAGGVAGKGLARSVVVADSDFADVVGPGFGWIPRAFVATAPGADVERVRAAIEELAAPYLVVAVTDAEEYGDAMADEIEQMLVIVYALLGLSIVIAVLGIVNTLALSVSERTREIGLLRAVGLSRSQVASMVTIESVLTALFGTALGVVVGAGLGSALTVLFEDEGLRELAVPWGRLGLVLGLAVPVGAVAAVWPAARAARTDVLAAIAYE